MKSEEQRIKDVYKTYAEEDGFRRRWSADNPGNHAITSELWAAIAHGLTRARLPAMDGRRILDVGCGVGSNLGRMLRFGARPSGLFGVDLLPERIEKARAAWPEITFKAGNGKELPFESGSFDIVMFFTVMSSILDKELAQQVAREAARVLRPAGVVIWYDMRLDNPWNANIRGIGRDEITRLFPGFRPDLRSLSVVPPLARRLGRLTPWLYPLLTRVPFLHSHYLGFLERKAGT